MRRAAKKIKLMTDPMFAFDTSRKVPERLPDARYDLPPN
jgi:hypothetical protein